MRLRPRSSQANRFVFTTLAPAQIGWLIGWLLRIKRKSVRKYWSRRVRVSPATFRARAFQGIRKKCAPRNSYGKSIERKELMKRIVVGFVCTMIAPLAFAQTVAKTSAVEHTGQVQKASTQITTGAVKIGTVTAFNPGQRPIEPASPIVVQSSPDTKPVSYMLGKKVLFVDKDGRAV